MAKGKAIILEEIGMDKFKPARYDMYDPEEGCITAKIAMCGICGTDVHVAHGRLEMPLPAMLGHEWCGTVTALGKNVSTDYVGNPLKVGDYVTSAVGRCGHCWFCRNTPRENLCENISLIGLWGTPAPVPKHFYGAYSEMVYLEPQVPVFKFPEGLTIEEMCMAEPMMVATRVWKRAMAAGQNCQFDGEGVDVSQHLVILGSGPIGMSILVVALVHGMKSIVVIDPIEERLEVAKKLGAMATINPKEVDTIEKRVERVKELTGQPVGADVVIEATGEPPAFVEAFKHVRRGGTFVEMGHYTDTGDGTVNPHHDFTNKDIQCFGMWAHTKYDMKTDLAIMAKAKDIGIPFGDIIAKKAGIDETPEMLKLHEDRKVPGKIGVSP